MKLRVALVVETAVTVSPLMTGAVVSGDLVGVGVGVGVTVGVGVAVGEGVGVALGVATGVGVGVGDEVGVATGVGVGVTVGVGETALNLTFLLRAEFLKRTLLLIAATLTQYCAPFLRPVIFLPGLKFAIGFRANDLPFAA